MRFDRTRFAIFGLPATVNALAMLVIAFNTTFRVGSGYRWLLPLAIALACFGQAIWAAVRRGRDLGWAPASTIGIFVVCVFFGPAVLLIVGVLCFLPARAPAAQFGPPPDGAGPLTILIALGLAGVPWLLALLMKLI